MVHIHPKALLSQDMVDVLDTKTGKVTRMHAVDAKHALSVEPKRYEIVMPEAPEVIESEPEPAKPKWERWDDE